MKRYISDYHLGHSNNVGCMMKYMDYTPRTLKEIRERAGGFE